jgi:pimeloyl-ACP methyl ester carboxylesterase
VPVQYPFPVQKLSIHDKIEIAYGEMGSGPETLLFIHGLANYAPVWNLQMQELSKSYRCIALDLPGNGLSTWSDFPVSMVFYAESVARFIEAKNLGSVSICGHSMGGQLALILALRYPALVNKLILIAPAGFEAFSPHEVVMMEQWISLGRLMGNDEAYLESTIRQSFYANRTLSDKIIQDLKDLLTADKLQYWHNMAIGSIKAMLKEQIHTFLPQVQQSALVIFGEEDAMIPNRIMHFGETPSSIGKQGTAMMPDARLKLIPRAGHFVMIEKAAEVNDEIKSFMSTKPGLCDRTS